MIELGVNTLTHFEKGEDVTEATLSEIEKILR